MKRRLSIKGRITLWYAALIVFICLAALISLFVIVDHAQEEHCRETLENATFIIMDEMEVEHNLLEIDADIDEVPGVYAALFNTNGELVYGRDRAELPFGEGPMRRAQAGEQAIQTGACHRGKPYSCGRRKNHGVDRTCGRART